MSGDSSPKKNYRKPFTNLNHEKKYEWSNIISDINYQFCLQDLDPATFFDHFLPAVCSYLKQVLEPPRHWPTRFAPDHWGLRRMLNPALFASGSQGPSGLRVDPCCRYDFLLCLKEFGSNGFQGGMHNCDVLGFFMQTWHIWIVRGKSMFHTRGGALRRINEIRHVHKNQLLIVISFAYIYIYIYLRLFEYAYTGGWNSVTLLPSPFPDDWHQGHSILLYQLAISGQPLSGFESQTKRLPSPKLT